MDHCIDELYPSHPSQLEMPGDLILMAPLCPSTVTSFRSGTASE